MAWVLSDRTGTTGTGCNDRPTCWCCTPSSPVLGNRCEIGRPHPTGTQCRWMRPWPTTMGKPCAATLVSFAGRWPSTDCTACSLSTPLASWSRNSRLGWPRTTGVCSAFCVIVVSGERIRCCPASQNYILRHRRCPTSPEKSHQSQSIIATGAAFVLLWKYSYVIIYLLSTHQ